MLNAINSPQTETNMPVFSPSTSTSVSPYAAFEKRSMQWREDNGLPVLDYCEAPLYESEYYGLRSAIIERNDITLLNQYLTKYPKIGLPVCGDVYDPFLHAAAHGSTDALRALLEHCAARPNESDIVDESRPFLLYWACMHAQVDTVRFLLTNESVFRHAYPWIGNIHTRVASGWTALLAAAISFPSSSSIDEHNNMDEEAARSEQLMNMLLDMGACARDVIEWPRSIEPDPIIVASVPRGEIFSDTVLSLSISQASPGLVKRLIDEGADRQSKTLRSFNEPVYAFTSRKFFQGVTPLHIGGLYLNVAGIQVLLDHRGGDINIVDMVSSRDNRGSLPLHWAAGGPGRIEEDYKLAGRDITLQTIGTFKLLLAPDPTTINARDDQGETALFWATRNHGNGGRKHFDILKFLCDNGADASVRDRSGQTPLHWLGFPRWSADPIDIAIIDLFLAHGAKISDTDLDGNTPLHLAARCLGQVEAVRFLLSRGADTNAENSKGNTPLHEVVDNPRWMQGLGITRDDNLRAQDEMLRELQEVGGSVNLMDQKNASGKTPLQIRDEKRREWQEWDRKRLAERRGMGRGRGAARPRVQ